MVYIARVRSVIEYGAQIYGFLLNGRQSDELEQLQVKCCQIILGANSRSYEKNLAALELPRLSTHREVLMKDFAISCYRSSVHRWWFSPNVGNK